MFASSLTTLSVPSFTVGVCSYRGFLRAGRNAVAPDQVSLSSESLARAENASLFSLRSASVTEGSIAPDFTLLDQNGEAVTLSKLRGQPVVLAFYPAASSPGCTKELCAFRDELADFESVQAVVLGISSNTVEEQKRFADTHGYRFRLLADVGGKVRKLYSVPSTLGVLPGRVTYVIDKEGKVVKVHNSQMDFASHVAEAKRALALMRS
ncbi:hypothetical protein F1559_001616 [Cyanidiococcus yangmingshanensis]|uniref:thioredoxin-dependent peroxiredoxin n=1 Tax=Cyanidiococcus yangmingshanensis TaxID=2690220 RepID=A0A7J7IIM1_9RHOD|nr:hypothetical protein F1559_001616 [Cyanidiococcus yangmingshanensis]